MSMVAFRAGFLSDIIRLWEVEMPSSHIETCDKIETFWRNARITGSEAAAPPVFVKGVTYSPMATLSVPGGTAASAAVAIETALTLLCSTSVFTATPPSVATPPPIPIPGGPATPGLLTSRLTGIFTAGAQGTLPNPASSAATAFADFLAGWQILVAVPPATASPVPII